MFKIANKCGLGAEVVRAYHCYNVFHITESTESVMLELSACVVEVGGECPGLGLRIRATSTQDPINMGVRAFDRDVDPPVTDNRDVA
jgi:hypothetical protein